MAGFVFAPIQAGEFTLASYLRSPPAGFNRDDLLLVYIEGDGAPWPSPFIAPFDPTPLRPVALEMALADSSAHVAYLGRPCQYLSAEALSHCDSAWWVEKRFAPPVIAAYDDAITQLKSLSATKRIRLFGYSGGGVIATLLAVRRTDVEALVTVAAPLALQEWLLGHGASPLSGSLDPDSRVDAASLPPSLHFVGAQDAIVPPRVVRRFVERKGGRVVEVASFTHECCWSREWSRLLREYSVQEVAK